MDIRSVLLATALGLVAVVSACGDVGTEDDASVLRLTASNLYSGNYVLFTVSGDGIVGTSVGARGSQVDSSGYSSVSFRRLPEGIKVVNVYGWNMLGTEEPNPAVWGSDRQGNEWIFDAFGTTGEFSIQGNRSQNLSVTATSFSPANEHYYMSKWMLNAEYEFDANDDWAGSIDGSNWAYFLVDNAGAAGTSVQVSIPDGRYAGLFTSIPPTGLTYGPINTWPDTLSGTLDANGDFLVAVMAMPGWSGRDVTIEVELGFPDLVPEFSYTFRIAGLGNLDVAGH